MTSSILTLLQKMVFRKSDIKIHLMILAFLFVTAGCRESINNIHLDSTTPHLVVEGYISTDTRAQEVKLSKMTDALMKNTVQAVSNAIITISDGSQTFELTEDQSRKGTYLTAPDVHGVVGRTYNLLIKNVDVDNDKVMEEYTAQSQIKKVNPIDSIHVVTDNSNPHFKGWSINLFTMDPGQGRNFYLIKVLKNNQLLTDSIFKYSVGDNTGFEGKYFDGFPAYILHDSRQDEKLSSGDTITLELYGITEDYYSFICGYILDYFPKIPIFSGPSANISTNIKPRNKAVGIFTAYSVTRKSVVYK